MFGACSPGRRPEQTAHAGEIIPLIIPLSWEPGGLEAGGCLGLTAEPVAPDDQTERQTILTFVGDAAY